MTQIGEYYGITCLAYKWVYLELSVIVDSATWAKRSSQDFNPRPLFTNIRTPNQTIKSTLHLNKTQTFSKSLTRCILYHIRQKYIRIFWTRIKLKFEIYIRMYFYICGGKFDGKPFPNPTKSLLTYKPWRITRLLLLFILYYYYLLLCIESMWICFWLPDKCPKTWFLKNFISQSIEIEKNSSKTPFSYYLFIYDLAFTKPVKLLEKIEDKHLLKEQRKLFTMKIYLICREFSNLVVTFFLRIFCDKYQ